MQQIESIYQGLHLIMLLTSGLSGGVSVLGSVCSINKIKQYEDLDVRILFNLL